MPFSSDSSVATLARQVRSGDLKAEALIERAVAAHSRHGDALDAYVEWGGERALERARGVDALVASGADPGPLAGIPISVKDLYGVDGFRTRAGTAGHLPARWERTGPFVAGLLKAGAIVTGKTHTVEMAFGGVGMNPHRGTPVNPWDGERHRVPGGSSSGAGVSLHEGSALIALGSDTGGSIRIPASATGVVGHKSTAGRWSTTGVVPLSTTLDTVGALTRTVEDAAYLLEVLDSCTVEAPPLERLRLGVPEGSEVWAGAAPDVARVVQGALSELQELGVTLVPVEVPELDQATRAYLSSGIPSSECAAFLRRCLPEVVPTLDPTVARRLASALDRSAADYLDALAERDELAGAVAQRFDGVDLIASPTLPITPPTVESLEPLEAYFAANRSMLSNTCPVSYLGLCALSVPAGLDGENMPVGLQLVAPGAADAPLLGWGRAVEAGLGTASRRLGTPPRLMEGRPRD